MTRPLHRRPFSISERYKDALNAVTTLNGAAYKYFANLCASIILI